MTTLTSLAGNGVKYPVADTRLTRVLGHFHCTDTMLNLYKCNRFSRDAPQKPFVCLFRAAFVAMMAARKEAFNVGPWMHWYLLYHLNPLTGQSKFGRNIAECNHADKPKTLAMRNTSIWQYISSKTLIVWPYQYTFLHKNCIVTAYLNPTDKIYKIVKYKSNIQKSQNQKLLKIYRIIKAQVKS